MLSNFKIKHGEVMSMLDKLLFENKNRKEIYLSKKDMNALGITVGDPVMVSFLYKGKIAVFPKAIFDKTAKDAVDLTDGWRKRRRIRGAIYSTVFKKTLGKNGKIIIPSIERKTEEEKIEAR